jgi:hypothetical protein
MTQLAGARNLIQSEEVQYRAAVSESVGQRMGSSINLLINGDYYVHRWEFLGPGEYAVPYYGALGSGNGNQHMPADIWQTPLYLPKNMQVLDVGVGISNQNGPLSIDLFYAASGGIGSSILSRYATLYNVNPAFYAPSPPNQYYPYSFVHVGDGISGAATAPVVASSTLNANGFLFPYLIAAPSALAFGNNVFGNCSFYIDVYLAPAP